MKFFVILATLISSFSTFAIPEYQTWEDEYGVKYVYIEGLKEDLFQKYKIKDSRGPKWGKDGDFLGKIVGESFYERHTYWSESGYPTEMCPNFSEVDFDDATEDGYGLSWESVKKVKGSQRSVFYLGTYIISISTPAKSCTYKQSPEQRYVFLNKLKDGKPIYLGQLSEYPKK